MSCVGRFVKGSPSMARVDPGEERAHLLFEVDLEELTRWAIEGRYPENIDEATTTDAARPGELAEQVTTLAHRALEEAKTDGDE